MQTATFPIGREMEEGERIVLWPHRKAASPCGRSAALESRPLTRRPGREGRRPSGQLTEPASPRHKALVSGPLQPRSKARLPFCRHYWKSRVAAADGRCQASCRGQHTRPRCGIAAVARGDPPQQGAVGGPRRWRCRASSVLVPVALLAVPRPPLPMTPTQAAGPDWCWPTCGQVPVPPAGSV